MAAPHKPTAVACALRQAEVHAIAGTHSAAANDNARRPFIAPELLDDEQSAELLGVSRRKFHSLRGESWWPVRAVVLGPRLMRWPRAELIGAIAAMPREQAKASEPAALARARIAKMKTTGVPA